jgi:hypothetical protein
VPIGTVAAGCGGNGDADRGDYEKAIVDTRDRVENAFGSISEAQNRKEFANRMEEAGVAIGRAATDLGEKDSPDEFKDETDQLEAALHELASDLEGTAAQLRQTPEIFNVSAGLSFEGWTNTNRVLQTLGKQGIPVEPLERH